MMLNSSSHGIGHESSSDASSFNNDLDSSSIVRSVMYRYSKKSQDKFLGIPELCYLFIYFSMQPSAKSMIIKKIESKGNEYTERILRDIASLSHLALLALYESENTEKS